MTQAITAIEANPGGLRSTDTTGTNPLREWGGCKTRRAIAQPGSSVAVGSTLPSSQGMLFSTVMPSSIRSLKMRKSVQQITPATTQGALSSERYSYDSNLEQLSGSTPHHLHRQGKGSSPCARPLLRPRNCHAARCDTVYEALLGKFLWFSQTHYDRRSLFEGN